MLLVQFRDGIPARRCTLLMESQTEPDEVRRRRWPYYIAFLQGKYECPVLLLVVCSKQETAEWSSLRPVWATRLASRYGRY